MFQGLISLDLASHYMQMYTTLTMGGTAKSHKKVDERRHGWLMTVYYTNTVGGPGVFVWEKIEKRERALIIFLAHYCKTDGSVHALCIE